MKKVRSFDEKIKKKPWHSKNTREINARVFTIV